MKKILSLILTAAMLLSAAMLTVGAENIGEGVYAPMAPAISEESTTQALDENQIDAQGIYYTLDDEDMTAIVGKNTYADTASAAADLKTDSIVIPTTVTFGDESYAVVAVGRNAFDGTAVREVVIPCATIGEFAFAGCTKLEYVWASAATEIKGFAFWGCTALTEVYCYMADSIGGGAFWNCSNIKTVTLAASTIMEKAFEGCDSLEYIVFRGNAPAVAAGALGTTAKAYIFINTTGYEDFPLETEVMTAPILDVEDVYAKAGENVEVSVFAPATLIGSETVEINITAAEGLTVEGIIFGENNMCRLENAVYDTDAGKITGNLTVTTTLYMPIVVLNVKVADDAAAGKYEITATIDNYISISGSVTVCDHADTKTVTVKSASCEEAGVANTVCTACGEIISSADVEAKGHTYKDFVIAPTCTEGGYTRHICEVCADAYTDTEVEALGHAWNEGEVIVEASTTKEGLVRYTCMTCGTTEDEIIPKVKYGDANSDGSINLTDVSAMLQFIAKWDMTGNNFSEANADVNVDGTVNLSDITKVLQYIAKWDVVLGPTK